MALGEYGTTLLDELNRLANGGTYRTSAEMVDMALAARQWAERIDVPVDNTTDTVGILNTIYNRQLPRSEWLDFNGVCNLIAGTFQLPAAQALRGISE